MEILKKPVHSGMYIPSLDFIRLLAIILVTSQHGCSVLNHEEFTHFWGVSIGQFGVSIFCALSGFLAFNSSQPANKWLKRRLLAIFPTYWIAMLVSFGLTWALGHKAFDAYQFFSQMFGLGFFTHGWKLVNVASWFISLLLLCYGLTYIARLTPFPILFMSFFLLIAIIFVGFRINIELSRHVMSFCGAAIIGKWFKYVSPNLWPLFVLPLWLLVTISAHYLYAATALFTLVLSLMFQNVHVPGTDNITPYIYEYFLIHGIFFVGVTKLFASSMPILSLSIATFCSLIAAWALKHSIRFLKKALQVAYGAFGGIL